MANTIRVVSKQISALLQEIGAISIDGAKGVGKTFTARTFSRQELLLDDPEQLEITKANSGILESSDKPLLIDEWQHYPPVWDAVRRQVDKSNDAGRFILTGSASPLRPTTHSGAGRIVSIHMRPFSLQERGIDSPSVSLASLLSSDKESAEITGSTEVTLEDYVNEICLSGFPGIRKMSSQSAAQLLNGYVERIVEHDFPELGHIVRKPNTLYSWLRAYAAATSTTASYETIRDASTSNVVNKPARNTATSYQDILKQMWILEPLNAWVPQNNPLKQMAFSQKHHLVDPALAAKLLKLNPNRLLYRSKAGNFSQASTLGALFESLATQSVRIYADSFGANVYHLRTQGGLHEIDLIVESEDGRIVAIEVKLSADISDHDVKHLHWLKRNVRDVVDLVVLNTGRFAYRRKDGVAVIPLALLGV